jgi:DNA-binding SARP family transcriptional activator
VLRAFTFGQCTFETPTSRIAPDAEVHFALLLSLAAGPPEGVPRDELVERVWPLASADDGRHCLRQAMYRLRRLGVPVRLQSGHVVLEWERVALDLHGLLHGATERAELVRLGALPFLPGYAPSLGDAFGDWLEALRARVATRLRRALADEVVSARNRGRFHDMGQLARALLALDPLNEIGTTALAESLVLEGSKVEGLRLLEDYEDEVGTINPDLQVPVRLLRRRISEVLDDSLALDRFESPFVGREREFARLRALLREVRSGTAQAVFVTGEAGIGKTRLVDEVLRLAALDGATIARYTTSSGDTFTPISTLVSVGRLLLTLPGALGCDQEQLTYIRRLGVPEAVTTWNYSGMAADILYAQLVHAFAELVSAIADEAPLLLFLDDAERLHPTTWRVLVDIWDRVGDRGVFFLLGARRLPEWFGSLGARTCERRTQHVPLFAFAREESLAFLAQWSERNQVPLAADLAQRLAGLSAGNPFHLSELAAHVARGGDPEQVPSGIHELITAQQLVLSSATQRVLLAIAVLERRATTARVTRLLELPAAEFLAAIDELEAAGLVSTSGPEIWCRHRLVGRVALDRSRESVLHFAHARAAALLEEEADGTDSVELLGDCVTHWELAGELKRAYEAAMKLGSRLVGMGMGEEAERAFARAEEIALDDSSRALAVEGALVALRLAARWFSVGDVYKRRMTLRLKQHQDPTPIDRYQLLHLESSLWANRPDDGILDAKGIVRDAAQDVTLRVEAALLLAMYADNYYDADLLRDAYMDLASTVDNNDLGVAFVTLALVFHCSVGDIACVNDLARSLIEATAEASDFRLRLQGLRRASIGLWRIGQFDEAERVLLRVLNTSDQLKLPHQSFATLECLVDVALAKEDVQAAHGYLGSMRSLAISEESEYLALMLDAASVRIAWYSRDSGAVAHYSRGYFQHRESPIPSFTHQLLSNELALAVLRRDSEGVRSLIEPLQSLHCLGRSMGRQDYTTEVLLEGMLLDGRVTQARRLAFEYHQKFRRELGRAPSSLVRLDSQSASAARDAGHGV